MVRADDLRSVCCAISTDDDVRNNKFIGGVPEMKSPEDEELSSSRFSIIPTEKKNGTKFLPGDVNAPPEGHVSHLTADA